MAIGGSAIHGKVNNPSISYIVFGYGLIYLTLTELRTRTRLWSLQIDSCHLQKFWSQHFTIWVQKGAIDRKSDTIKPGHD